MKSHTAANRQSAAIPSTGLPHLCSRGIQPSRGSRFLRPSGRERLELNVCLDHENHLGLELFLIRLTRCDDFAATGRTAYRGTDNIGTIASLGSAGPHGESSHP
jgi:hypothetical protein